MHLTPAEFVIYRFGGVHATARAIGRTPASVCKWQKPRKWKGSKGYIPVEAQKRILKVASDLQLDITLEDLHYGRELSRNGKNNPNKAV